MKSPEEQRLSQHFESQRTADRDAAALFSVTLAAAHARRQKTVAWRAAPAWSVVAVLIALGVGGTILTHLRPSPPVAPQRSIAEWSSPTSFLLDTPGRRLLETTPRIGVRPLLPGLDARSVTDDAKERF